MEVVNIDEAKTHLSRLMEKVANGESFIIAKAGPASRSARSCR
jgi:antitoxin (DNA-binding transcriptional repressor) of toxin-antitoxin stability system